MMKLPRAERRAQVRRSMASKVVVPSPLSRADAEDYYRSACYAAGQYPSTNDVRLQFDAAGGDLDKALKAAKLPPRAKPSAKPKLVSQLSAKLLPGAVKRSDDPEVGAVPPPVKITRSGSAHFHTGMAYPAAPIYHAPNLRNGFIRKVYGILCAQMFITFAISAGMMYTPPIREFTLSYASYFIWPIIIFSLVAVLGLRMNKDSYPANYLWLFGFTVIESILVGFVCTVYLVEGMGDVVLEAFVLTTTLFLALTLYACQSKVNFEFMGAGLFAGLWLMIVWGLLQALFFGPFLGVGRTVYALVGSLLFCLFIIYDTWKVCKVYGYDDYIVAAIELYLDIINLFLFLLQLLSKR